MNWKLIVAWLTVPVGFLLTSFGAIQFDRLQVEGVDMKWWSYPVSVLLPWLGSAAMLAVRTVLRNSGTFAAADPTPGAMMINERRRDLAAQGKPIVPVPGDLPAEAKPHARSLAALATEASEAMARGDTAQVRVKADAADVIQGKAKPQ